MVQQKTCQSAGWIGTMLLFVSLGVSGVSGQTTVKFPIKATIASSNTSVHSGPAKVHYATDRLARGTQVKVYRLDPEGWCAVEPPKRSFSIIPEGQIEQTDVDLGVVKSDDTVAWVGTLLGTVNEPMWQIKLKKGEQVDILGLVETPGADGEPNQAWFQIAPPAGEFRWIHISQLALDSQTDIKIASGMIMHNEAPEQNRSTRGQQLASGGQNLPSRRQYENPKDSSRPQRIIDDVQQTDQTSALANSRQRPDSSSMLRKMADEPNTGSRGFNSTGSIETSVAGNLPSQPIQQGLSNQTANHEGWRPAKNPSRIYTSATDDRLTYGNSNSQDVGNTSIPVRPIDTTVSGQVNPRTANTRQTPLVQSNVVQPTTLSNPNQITQQLDLDLAIEMTKPPENWNFDNILRRANQLKGQTNQTEVRNSIDQFLSKLAGFRNANRQSSFQSTTPSPESQGLDSSVADLRNSERQQILNKYDAYGTLEELVRDGGLGQSTYVLRDESGKITHHVQATANLNLHRYLKKKIGIVGQRGFNQSTNLSHVTASRVIELNRIFR